MSKLSDSDKIDIIKHFLLLITKSSRKKLATSKRAFIKYCFNKIINDKKALNMILVYLECPYHFNSGFYNSNCTPFNMLFLAKFKPSDTVYNQVLNSFANDVIDSIPEKDFHKILNVSDKSFSKLAKPYIHKHNLRFNHIIGIIWLVGILIFSLIIPNHAINLTGITFGNFFICIGHFLLIQFENLINPALIGRLLINVIADIPIIHHYFVKKI